jgi:hypothetical protein
MEDIMANNPELNVEPSPFQSIEDHLLKILAEEFGIHTNHVTPTMLSLIEVSTEFDLLPADRSVSYKRFLTHREILERRARVEDMCGIDSSATRHEMANRALGLASSEDSSTGQ